MTEQRLEQLQTDAGGLLMSAEEDAEIERFIAERSRIRKELRAVQRELNADIETLGMRLKLLNTLALPLLITLLSLLIAWRRAGR